jgi:DUF4097 and DUF4098 domain-containing protein YvlB
MRRTLLMIVLAAATVSPRAHAGAPEPAFQSRNNTPERADAAERISRRVRIEAGGRFSISNIAGDIAISGASGNEIVIDAVKRGRASSFGTVRVDVAERPGRVEVRTTHTGRSDNVSVDYTVAVPQGISVDAKSISGDVRVRNVDGQVHAESVSGSVVASAVPKLAGAKSISGDITVIDSSIDGDLNVGSISGAVRVKSVKARTLEMSTVSGDLQAVDIACDRVAVKSVSGNLDFSGALARTGRYEFNSHSGEVRLSVSETTGFELTADTFSGTIHSTLPITINGTAGRGSRAGRGPEGGRGLRGTLGDGSAVLTVRTFSGDIALKGR